MARLLAILAVLVVAQCALAAGAWGVTFTVTKTADTDDDDCSLADCSLREALADPTPFDEDRIVNVPAGTYELTEGELVITQRLQAQLLLDGAGAASTVIRQTEGFRVIDASLPTAANATIRDVTITEGNALPNAQQNDVGNGGGIRKQGSGSLTVENSVISGNRAAAANDAEAGGGGIYNFNLPTASGGALTVVNTTVENNTSGETNSDNASNGGGGIHHQSPGALTISNSTIDGNTAIFGFGSDRDGGGGVFVRGGPTTITHSTITGNRVLSPEFPFPSGGGIFNGSDTLDVALANTIVASNSAPTDPDCGPDPARFLSFAGGNLSTGATCNLTHPADKPNTDPQLAALADNGGPTPTRALLGTSPAIDGGVLVSCLFADQRAVARPQGPGCDIGAFELVQTEPPPPPPPDLEPPDTTVGSGPLGLVRDRTPTFVFGSNDPGATFECRLDAVAFAACSSPFTAARLGAGPHTFEVRAVDAAGNRDPSPGAQDFTIARILADLPRPALGRTFNVEPLKGTVLIALPGGGAGSRAGRARASQKGLRFEPLRQARQIPMGSFLDTKKGTVRMVSATPTRSRTQRGDFSAGLFQVLQSRVRKAKGLTKLRLKGSSFDRCRTRRAGKRSDAGAAALSKKTIRKLRGNAKGNYQTGGKHSAATVRGTIWITADRCDGTLTTVKRGKVSVRDFRRKRTITVRAGRSYLARAPQ